MATHIASFRCWRVSIDLKTPQEHELFMRLVKGFDVFVENYASGVVERLGIDYETLKKEHPGLIYGRIKGRG